MSNQTDIQTMFSLRKAEALTEYRQIILRNPTPSAKDVERLIVLGGILGFSGADIQKDIGVSASVVELQDKASQYEDLCKQISAAYEGMQEYDREEYRRREQVIRDRYEKVERKYIDLLAPKMQAEQAKEKLDKIKVQSPRLFDVRRKQQSSLPQKPRKPMDMVFVQRGTEIAAVPRREAEANKEPYKETMPLPRG